MEIRVDKTIYSRQVLLKTAYTFTDKAYLHLAQDSDYWIISWTDKPDQDVIPEMFENELISQQLREDLIEKTKDIRKLLLSRAMASSVIDLPCDKEQESVLKTSVANEETAAIQEKDILRGWFDS